MEEMTLDLLNEIIEEIAPLDCDAFSNLFIALSELTDELEEFHKDEILLFLGDSLNVVSEAELEELSNSEKRSFVRFLKDLI